MVIIQRGGTGDVVLDGDEALATLLENCEDAYGFPPYSEIEHFLHSHEGAQLQTAERETIARALHGVKATLMRSETMDWATRLGALLGPAVKPVAIAGGAPPRRQRPSLAQPRTRRRGRGRHPGRRPPAPGAPARRGRAAVATDHIPRTSPATWAALAAVLVLAAFLRLWDLQALGANSDEAVYAGRRPRSPATRR